MNTGTTLIEVFGVVLAAIFLLGGGIVIVTQLKRNEQEQQHFTQKRAGLEARAIQRPADTKLAWDLASATLEQYFSRNLQQVRLIFIFSVAVMFAGLGVIVAGILMAYAHPNGQLGAIISTAAGVLTQFIGASFMVVYRSTMDQAQGFSQILERINRVGMAMEIVESIPANDPLYIQTRADMARMLVSNSQWQPFAENAAPRV